MKVLIAEDDPVSCRLLESFLAKWGYQAIAVTDGAEAWKVLQQEDCPRLAILDWMIPKMDGSQVCQALRKRNEQQYVYVILVTAKAQKGDVVEGLEAGADDYLIKPFDKHELKARLNSGVRIVELQQQLIVAREALREQVSHDSLTGALSRAAILELLQREIARSKREGNSPCLAIADVDHFKSINDTHGHLVGDAVLREVIRRLRSTIRPYDAVGRYGGEEFLIVTPNGNAAGALKMAERLRASIADKPFDTKACIITVTVSLGVAVCVGEIAAETLIRLADTALYRAKNRGRNRVEFASGNDAEATSHAFV